MFSSWQETRNVQARQRFLDHALRDTSGRMGAIESPSEAGRAANFGCNANRFGRSWFDRGGDGF